MCIWFSLLDWLQLQYMADVDDLLGGPSAGLDELDDLLGGAAVPDDDNLAFDDDLLGGGGGQVDEIVNLDDDDLLGGDAVQTPPAPPKTAEVTAAPPPPPEQGRRRAVAFPALKEFPDGLRAYAGSIPDIFFIRACRAIGRDQLRTKKIIAITTENILVFDEGSHTDPVSHSVSKVFGIITQTVLIPKRFGVKEAETHVLVQIDGSADIFFALSKESENGSALNDSFRDRDVLQALSAVCAAMGVTIPMSSLKDEELIEKFYNAIDTVRGDEKVRKQESELLSIRTALLYELKVLKKESESLYARIESAKASEAGSAKVRLMEQLKDAKDKLADLEATAARQSKEREAALKANKAARLALETEDERRSTAAKTTLETVAQEALHEQLAEYEIMKNAHRRETEKLGALTSIHERRLNERGGKTSYVGVADISLRMESLEEEIEFIDARTKYGKDQHTRHLTVLTQAKKLSAAGKERLQTILDEITELQKIKDALPSGALGRVPEHISRDAPEKLTMPQFSGSHAPPPAAATPKPAAVATASASVPSAAPPAGRPPIDLSDDDI